MTQPTLEQLVANLTAAKAAQAATQATLESAAAAWQACTDAWGFSASRAPFRGVPRGVVPSPPTQPPTGVNADVTSLALALFNAKAAEATTRAAVAAAKKALADAGAA